MDTSGFYKLDIDELLFVPNFIYSKDFELLREKHAEYNYPIFGWYWFETEEDAKIFLNV